MNYMTFTEKKWTKMNHWKNLPQRKYEIFQELEDNFLKYSNQHTKIQEAIVSIKIKNKLLLKERIKFKKEKEREERENTKHFKNKTHGRKEIIKQNPSEL